MDILNEFYRNLHWDAHYGKPCKDSFMDDSVTSIVKETSSYCQLYLSDSLYTSKYNAADKVAADLFIEESRRLGNIDTKDQLLPKKRLRPGELEMSNRVDFPKISSFTRAEINKYTALHRRFRFGLAISEKDTESFTTFMESLRIEQTEYQNFAMREWYKQNYLRHANILPGVFKYINHIWQERLSAIRNYHKMYLDKMQIPLLYNSGEDIISRNIEMIPKKVLKITGESGIHNFIPKHTQTYLCTDYDQLVFESPPNKNKKYSKVSCDPLAEDLTLTTDAQVVISGSGLKCLLDTQLSSMHPTWYLPVVVKEVKCNKTKGKQTRRVVYIDKKLPPSSMTLNQRVYWHSKIAARILSTSRKDSMAFNNIVTKPSVPDEIESDVKSLFDNKVEESLSPPSTSLEGFDVEMEDDSDVDRSNELVMDISDDDSDVTKVKNVSCEKRQSMVLKRESSTHKPVVKELKKESVSSKCDVNNDSSFAQNISSQKHKNEKSGDNEDTEDYRYVYQMWNLGKTERNHLMKSDGEIIPIIVRSRHDCVAYTRKWQREVERNERHTEKDEQGEMSQTVHVVPKLEYQFDFGAEKVTSSENIRAYIDVMIRPNSYLIRVRVNPLTGEVIQIEKLDQQELRKEGLSKCSINHNQLWSSLYSVLSKLISLPVGEYMLVKTDSQSLFLQLWVVANNDKEGGKNILSKFNVSVEQVEGIKAPYMELDNSLETPMCRYNRTFPLIFPTGRKIAKPKKPKYFSERTNSENNPKKKKKKKKKKRKEKGKNKFVKEVKLM